MATLLAADIGGTKTLLSLYSGGGSHPELLVQQRYASADWDNLAPMVRHFLSEGPGREHPRPEVACFAVAGPVQGGRAQLTNLAWRLDEASLAQACGLTSVELVNDFSVLIHGLPHLQPSQIAQVRAGEAVAEAPRLVLGAGTGLGVAFGIPGQRGLQPVASEGAHADFAPRSDAEWQLREWLRQDLGLERVSIERVVSGTGLGHVARCLLDTNDMAGHHPLQEPARRWLQPGSAGEDLPAQVATLAASGDPLCREALDLWLGAYGSVTGDLALATLARGGIFLAGGTAAKLTRALASEAFRGPMLNKGRLSAVLESIPVTAITDPSVGSFSAACRARTLLA